MTGIILSKNVSHTSMPSARKVIYLNERDYKIIEAMVIASGVLVLITILAMFYCYSLPFDINIIIVICFIFFSTFFFGLFFHMKRIIYKREFEEIIEETKHG